MNMLQKKLFTFSNTDDLSSTSVIINPDGSTEKLQMDKFSSSYHCLIVFRGAFEPISSYEIIDFSKNVFKFQALNCRVMGLVRDSSRIVEEWMVKPLLEEKETNFVAFSCISSPELGKENAGLIQALGVPLVEGSPIPTIVISDRKNKIRYCASFNPNIPRSVEETLRVVAAIKMVDEAEGSALAPADWVSTEPVIKNSRAGILEYYKDKYDDKTQETGLWLSVKKLFGGQVPSSKNSTEKNNKKTKVDAQEKSGKNVKIDGLKKKSVDKEAKIDAAEKSGKVGGQVPSSKNSTEKNDKEVKVDAQEKSGENSKIDDLKKKSVNKEAKINAAEKSDKDVKIDDLKKKSVNTGTKIDAPEKSVD